MDKSVCKNGGRSGESGKAAVILLNMGGPTDISGVEGFLRRIFADPLILRIKNSFVRKMVGSLIINKRLESVKQNYMQIGGCSPLPAHTFALCQQLSKLDSSKIFTYAMRYTPPFARDVLQDLQAKGVQDIVLFSMYPQFSTTTTQSSLLDIYENLKALSYAPRVSVIDEYHAHTPLYELIADTVIHTLEHAKSAQDFSSPAPNSHRNPADFTLLLSAHSLPQKIVDSGDPYARQCEKGVEILTEVLESRGVHFANIELAYQSKVGPMRWLNPFTSDVISHAGGKRLIVYPLAFTIDNSETDYELNIQYRELAAESGVLEYLVCPCLNASEGFARMICALVESKLASLDSVSSVPEVPKPTD